MARSDLYREVKYTASGTKGAKLHKFKPGSNRFRVMPPLPTSGLKGNDWAVFHRVHWGYGINGKDGEGKPVTFPKPFFCLFDQDFKTKTVRVPCEHCAKIEDNANALKIAQGEGLKAGMSPDALKAHTALFTERQKRYSVEKKIYFNDLDADGTFGYRKVSYAHYKTLKDLMANLAADGIDPLHPDQGVYFEMVKTGEGFATRYTDPVVVSERNGRALEIKPAPLSDEQLEQAARDCANLQDGIQVLKLSPTQIKALADSNGTPEEVEAILGITQSEEVAAPALTPVVITAESVAALKRVVTNQTVTQIASPVLDRKAALLAQLAALEAEAAAPVPVVDPEIAALEAKLEAAKAARAPKAMIAQAQPVLVKSTPVALPEAKDAEVDDLLATFAASVS